MKKILLLLVCFLLVGCGTTQDENDKKSGNSYCGEEESGACKIDASADMSAYENFTDKENQFKESSMEEVLSMLENKENGVVYFGFPLCPWCVEALPIMNEVAKEKNIAISYVQTRDDDRKQLYSDEQKQRMMEYADAYLEKDDEGNKQFYVPFVIVIKDGKVVAGHIGTVSGYDTHERKMNDSEKAELKNIYTEMFFKLS